MFYLIYRFRAILVLIPFLLLLGCMAGAPGGFGHDTSGLDSAGSPLARPFPVPSPAVAVTAAPTQLLILHTNDDWGETEPCG